MSLKILGDRVLVKPDEAKTSERGIYLPESAQEKPQRGTIMAIGSGRTLKDGTLVPPDVKVGDRVLYARYGGTEVKVKDDKWLIMSCSSLYAVLND
jgi:chaperonin GroES